MMVLEERGEMDGSEVQPAKARIGYARTSAATSNRSTQRI